ncbi:MAG: MATE family efflux transporter [Spirochaetaceae bacterium]|jgi:putative MATE family efflux protein|nr:MATE family efflux transporter [Spirochaetaceae bacterium]
MDGSLRWTNQELFRLLWPLILEQSFNVTIGIADTVMVSTVGEAAVSGVSLVDAINVLLVIAFGALATGGSVVVSQYIGRKDLPNARNASKQLMYASLGVSVVIMGLTLCCYRLLLRLIYGNIAVDVADAARTYFWISALGYPFLAVYNAGASLFRSMGNSRTPMLVALLVNGLNIGGNALFIVEFHLGVAGAALATLISRAFAAVTVMVLLRSRNSGPISLRGLRKTPLDPAMIRRILNIGIPSGLESSLFQIGKLFVARLVSTFGTPSIAANAITSTIGSCIYMPGQGFGMAILIIVGQCVGARDYMGAKRYTKKLLYVTYGTLLLMNALIVVCMEPLVRCFNLSPEAKELAKGFLLVHCVSSSLAWPLSFALPNALRAAGDARYCMLLASISMFTVRLSLSYLLAFGLGLGAMSVWLGMAGDFLVRGTAYTWRWIHGRWQTKTVI